MKIYLIFFYFFLFPCEFSAQVISGNWTTASSYGFTPRYGHTSVNIDGKIYAIGGQNTKMINVPSIQVFDSKINTWTTPSTSGMFISRYALTSCLVDGKIYVMGGRFYGIPDTIEVFEPSTNVWSNLDTKNFIASRRAATINLIDGKIYLIGGVIEDSSKQIIYPSAVGVFNTKTFIWDTLMVHGSFTPRSGHSTSVVNGKIYVIGGYNGTTNVEDIEVFDPKTNTWSTPIVTGSFISRNGLTLCLLNGMIYAIGGDTVSILQVFDPLKNSWTTPITSGKFTTRLALTSDVIDSQIYVIGGITLLSRESITHAENEVFTPGQLNTVKSTVSISNIQLFPNPSKGIINIHSNIENISRLSVVNLLGETIVDLIHPPGSNLTLDLSKYSPGIYFVHSVRRNSVSVDKIMLE